MDPRTMEIHRFESEDARQQFESVIGRKMVPLTEVQARELEPLSNRRRKKLLRGMSCPCASGKSFKKCCWKRYRKRKR